MLLAPPWSGWLSIMSTSSPACLRKAAVPSGRWKGPEKSRRTVLEAKAGLTDADRSAGETQGLILSGVGDGRSDGQARRGRCLFPGKQVFVEVDFGREHYPRYTWYVHVVSSGRCEAASEIYADPCSGFNARFRVGFARLHRESAAAKWQDGHDSRLHAG
eukprot:2944478-Pleurochrysis_carterae.AAC.1